MSGALVERESQRSLDFMDESKNCLPGWIGKMVYSRTPRRTIRAPIVGYRELARSIPASKSPTPPLPRQGTAEAESNCALSVRNRSCQRVAEGRYGPIEISARHTLAAGCGIALRDGVVVKQNPRMGVDIQPHGARALSKGL